MGPYALDELIDIVAALKHADNRQLAISELRNLYAISRVIHS